MKILLCGTGAVGLGIASCLLKSNVSVDITARQNTVKLLSQEGLRRTGIFGDYSAPSDQFGSYTDIDLLPKTYYDYILICSKAYDVNLICEKLFSSNLLNLSNTKIVIFNNGWGTHDLVAQFTDKANIYNARVITGFIRNKPNQVDITVHADSIHIGNVYTNDPSGVLRLSEFINAGGVPCEIVSDIVSDLWAKMLYNCALNPVGAILGVPYGKLGEHAETRSIMDSIIEEVFDVILAMGYRTHWANANEYIPFFYSTLLPATYAHKSSMLQDIHAGKRTEIDFLNGVIVDGAKKVNKVACTNNMVKNLIKFKETTETN